MNRAGHHLPSSDSHRSLSRGIREQLVEGGRESRAVARRDGQAVDPMLEPVPDAPGRARDHRTPRRQGLDPDKTEGLRPQRGHHHDRCGGELIGELLGGEPAREANPVEDPEASSELAHRLQPPAVPADHELALHLAYRPEQHGDALGSHDSSREHHPSAALVS